MDHVFSSSRALYSFAAMLIRISLALFVVHCVRGQDALVQCEKISECSCEMNNGMGTIDISSLASPDPDNPRFVYIKGSSGLCNENLDLKLMMAHIRTIRVVCSMLEIA